MEKNLAKREDFLEEMGLELSLGERVRFGEAKERAVLEELRVNRAPDGAWQVGVTVHRLASGQEVLTEAQMIRQAGPQREWTQKIRQRHLDPKQEDIGTTILWNVFR